MRENGEGRELSVTFQTSGKAVRLSAPEKWRKAVAAQDLKPDAWVEITRQSGSPHTVRADDVPELHALFLELGFVSEAVVEADAPPEPAIDASTPAADEASEAAQPDEPAARPDASPWRTMDAASASPPPPGARRPRRRSGSVIWTVIGVVVLISVLRTCGRVTHYHPLSVSTDVSGAPSEVSSDAAVSADAGTQAASDANMATAAAALAASAAAPLEAATRPSFDCAHVTSANLKLVCDTPELAEADQTLAAAYQQALAASADPSALRDSERDWIASREQAPTDVDHLRALYAERIQFLRGQAGTGSAR
jgi:uncharacterized protein YecT (DUF1311 family)